MTFEKGFFEVVNVAYDAQGKGMHKLQCFSCKEFGYIARIVLRKFVTTAKNRSFHQRLARATSEIVNLKLFKLLFKPRLLLCPHCKLRFIYPHTCATVCNCCRKVISSKIVTCGLRNHQSQAFKLLFSPRLLLHPHCKLKFIYPHTCYDPTDDCVSFACIVTANNNEIWHKKLGCSSSIVLTCLLKHDFGGNKNSFSSSFDVLLVVLVKVKHYLFLCMVVVLLLALRLCILMFRVLAPLFFMGNIVIL